MIALSPVTSVLLIFLARMLELRVRRKIEPGRVQEFLTFRLFMVAGIVMMACGIGEFCWRKPAFSWPLFVAGWICALLSFFIRHQAIASLGRFWSVHVEIRPHHQLVQEGPFRWMRHPTYFSMILEMLSVSLILQAFGSLLPAALIFLPALRLRLRLEENALLEKFGDHYRLYQKNTPTLFPYRWPRKH